MRYHTNATDKLTSVASTSLQLLDTVKIQRIKGAQITPETCFLGQDYETVNPNGWHQWHALWVRVMVNPNGWNQWLALWVRVMVNPKGWHQWHALWVRVMVNPNGWHQWLALCWSRKCETNFWKMDSWLVHHFCSSTFNVTVFHPVYNPILQYLLTQSLSNNMCL